jgi:hypothetical protein
MARARRELIGLCLLAGLGFGLALARGDLFFLAVFGGASAMTIIELLRRPCCHFHGQLTVAPVAVIVMAATGGAEKSGGSATPRGAARGHFFDRRDNPQTSPSPRLYRPQLGAE